MSASRFLVATVLWRIGWYPTVVVDSICEPLPPPRRPHPLDLRARRAGFILCYGLFWSVHEINWFPRTDGGRFRLLGRRGKKYPNVRFSVGPVAFSGN